MQSLSKRFFALPLGMYLVLAFLFALISSALLAVTIGYGRGIGTDGAFYSLSGYHLFRGEGFTYSDVPNTFTWPMLSVFTGLLSLFIDDLQVCMHIVLTGAFALGVFPFFGIIRNLMDERAARVGVLLYVLNGFLWRMSARMTAESLLIFFLICAAYFVSVVVRRLRDRERLSSRYFAGAGISFGLAYLTKPEGAVFFIAVAAVIILMLLRRKLLRANLGPVLLLGVSFAATIAPQVHFIHEATGKWQLTTYNRFFFRGVIEPLWSLSPGAAATDPRVEYNYNAYIAREPYTGESWKRDLERLPKHLKVFFSCLWVVVGPVGVVLFVASVFVKRPENSSRSFIFAFLLPLSVYWLWYNPAERLFIVFTPFLTLLALEVAIAILETRSSHRQAAPLAVAMIVLFSLSTFLPISEKSPTNAVIGNHARMGTWIRQHRPEVSGKLLADRKPYVAFMARARYYRYNNMPDAPTLIRKLRENGVDYLMVDDYYTRQKNPGVIELLEGRDTEDLKFIHKVEDPFWGAAILYQVRKDAAP